MSFGPWRVKSLSDSLGDVAFRHESAPQIHSTGAYWDILRGAGGTCHSLGSSPRSPGYNPRTVHVSCHECGPREHKLDIEFLRNHSHKITSYAIVCRKHMQIIVSALKLAYCLSYDMTYNKQWLHKRRIMQIIEVYGNTRFVSSL
jgi:hypothetical protein